jgi:hypothetical protein
MDLRQVAKGAPYHLATMIEECPLWRFWVVLLDRQIQIFQTPDEASLDEHSTWMRLKQFCIDHDCKIVGMAFAQKDLNPAVQINIPTMADGYFYSKRIRKMMAANPAYGGYQDEAQGVGVLQGDELTIHWVNSDDGSVTIQKRSLDSHQKSTGMLGLIRSK